MFSEDAYNRRNARLSQNNDDNNSSVFGRPDFTVSNNSRETERVHQFRGERNRQMGVL